MMRRQSTGMKGDMIQRTSSDAGTSSSGGSTNKSWRLGTAIRKLGGMNSTGKEDKPVSRFGSVAETGETVSSQASIHAFVVASGKGLSRAPIHGGSGYGGSSQGGSSQRSAVQGSTVQGGTVQGGTFHGSTDAGYIQLHNLVSRVRLISAGPNHVDTAYKEFCRIKEQCAALIVTILHEEIKPVVRATSTARDILDRDNSLDGLPGLGGMHFDQRSSFSGHSLAEVSSAGGGASRAGLRGDRGDVWMNPIREWKSFLEALTRGFETHLADTYKRFVRDATPDMIQALFSSKIFRKEAILRMRNASVSRVLSPDPSFIPLYEIRFRNYERVKQELMDIRRLFQAGESGISPSRDILEISITHRGDVVLEFANLSLKATGLEPAMRFRVSSTSLADTSPIFARMFNGRPESYYVHEAEDISSQLPPAPVQHFCDDGSEVKLYRMPQLEVNHLQSLEILLHAAHNHKEKLTKNISFEQFVAVAHCCMRYKCTLPLEPIVEQWWLPQWMYKGADDMPDDLLIIGYAFGLRQLFARTSKSAILNLIDEEDLKSKSWPDKIRDKIWAVRCAKREQLYATCIGVIQDYLRQPIHEPEVSNEPLSLNELQSRLFLPVQPPMTFSSVPRCPKGSHWCDASNLGWLMLVFNEMGFLPHFLHPNVPTSHLLPSPETRSPPKTLARMMDILRLLPSSASPVHPGNVCDPAPPFLAAIADIYNSITGLSLHDISGNSHGWAMSKDKISEPQKFVSSALGRMGNHDAVYSVANEFPTEVLYRILTHIEDLKGLQAAALINRAFYETFKRYELDLMKRILRAGRKGFEPSRISPHVDDVVESKVLKSESDRLKERGFGDYSEVRTLRSEEDEEEASYSSDDGESRASHAIVHHDDMEFLTRDPPPPFRPKDSDPPPPPPTVNRQNLSLVRSNSAESLATLRRARTIEADDDVGHHLMTDEEARNILWPEQMEDPSLVPQDTRKLEEKFRLVEFPFAEEVEAKTLVDSNLAQLGVGGKRRVGVSKTDLLGGPGVK